MTAPTQAAKLLMNVLEELVTENTYVSTNSLPVLQWDEAGTDIGERYVLVQCADSQRLFATSDCFRLTASLHAMTYMGDDQSRASNNALYEEMVQLMHDLTIAACNGTTAIGQNFVVDGIIDHVQADGIVDSYWQQSIEATFFMQYEASPVNSVLPAITGTTEVGETLTCSTGTWTNANSYAYQWRRDEVNIVGGTSATYVLVGDDNATEIDCVVTATNTRATATATAAAVGPITTP